MRPEPAHQRNRLQETFDDTTLRPVYADPARHPHLAHATYLEAVKMLEDAGVAYVSIAEADWDNAPDLPPSFREAVREAFSRRILYAGRYTAERAERLIASGLADLVAFGRAFIANPDLAARIAGGWPLNPLRPETLYGGGAEGLTDYLTAGAAKVSTIALDRSVARRRCRPCKGQAQKRLLSAMIVSCSVAA